MGLVTIAAYFLILAVVYLIGHDIIGPLVILIIWKEFDLETQRRLDAIKRFWQKLRRIRKGK